jgi:uncharacterized protein
VVDRQDLEIKDNAELGRFEAKLGDELAGFGRYRLASGRITFTHTKVDPAFEGRGVGSKLVGHMLDSARARGLAVVPECPFVETYIKRHPEYADLIASQAPSESA